MQFNIENKIIGDDHPLFFIAEAGVNHNGSIDMGKELIDIAANCGADAVKFQSFITEEIITKNAPKSTYHIETTGGDSNQSWFDLLKTQEMSKEMHIELIDYCKKKNIIFLSTPYDEKSADLLDKLNVAAFKIASTDTNNLPFLSYVAKKGKPMIISTAMTSMDEVIEAAECIKQYGLDDLAVLQCTGNYPSEVSESNLKVIQSYKKQLKCIVGYSDHTPHLTNASIATALGAKIYEKHFTIDKKLPGPDHRMSLDPSELNETIKTIRLAEVALGSDEKEVLDSELENRLKLRKSIIALIDINEGKIINEGMVAVMRPGNGISPKHINKVIGKKALLDISSGTPISMEMINDK